FRSRLRGPRQRGFGKALATGATVSRLDTLAPVLWAISVQEWAIPSHVCDEITAKHGDARKRSKSSSSSRRDFRMDRRIRGRPEQPGPRQSLLICTGSHRRYWLRRFHLG